MGSKRQRPLQPPQPLFTNEELRRDPFRTPDVSVPPTPRSGVSNPFSPPASVVNLSSEQNMHGMHQSTPTLPSSPYYPFPEPGSAPSSRPHTGASRVSSLRNSTTDLHVREVPRPTGARSRRNSSNAHVRNSFMSPPAMPKRMTLPEGEGLTTVLQGSRVKRHRSTLLTGEVHKPWLTEKDFKGRLSYWLTTLVAMMGIVGAVIRVYLSYVQVPRIGNLCLIMEDEFETFDTKSTWFQEVDMGGFG